MKKRGQSEIMGIVVIVIILIIAGTFMVSTRLKKKKYDRSSFVDPELSQSFLNALMNTKTEKNVIVSDIIKDCYSRRNDLCGPTTTSDCCKYAELTIRNALESTLGKWGKSYRLTVKRGSDSARIGDNGIYNDEECDDFAEQEQPGFYYIPPPEPIIVKLQICKQ